MFILIHWHPHSATDAAAVESAVLAELAFQAPGQSRPDFPNALVLYPGCAMANVRSAKPGLIPPLAARLQQASVGTTPFSFVITRGRKGDPVWSSPDLDRKAIDTRRKK
jgi:hypothetical protein